MDVVQIRVWVHKLNGGVFPHGEHVKKEWFPFGSKFHSVFKAGGEIPHPLLHDRATFVVLWIAGYSPDADLSVAHRMRVNNWVPPMWELFRLDGMSDPGDGGFVLELTPLFRWKVADTMRPLEELYASDFGDSY
jgi:hypothetical protein